MIQSAQDELRDAQNVNRKLLIDKDKMERKIEKLQQEVEVESGRAQNKTSITFY